MATVINPQLKHNAILYKLRYIIHKTSTHISFFLPTPAPGARLFPLLFACPVQK
jgi:hypothetical protein